MFFREKIFNIALPFLKTYIKLTNSSYVTCFHRVSDEYSPGYPPMLINDFEKLIEFYSLNFDIVDLSESKPEKGYRKMSITFDDGYKDFQTNALPILNSYKCPVTQNVITDSLDTGKTHWTQQISKITEMCDMIGFKSFCEKELDIEISNNSSHEQMALSVYHKLKNFEFDSINEFIKSLLDKFELSEDIFIQMLTWSDIIEISQKNNLVKWGCHTKTHKNLSLVEDKSILEKEILLPKLKMEKELNLKIDRFAFPNGDASQKAFDFATQYFEWVQFTEFTPIKQINSNANYVNRNQPYYNSISENIFKSIGFHNSIFK
jgi:peptidoglycan/xylan/chitin deacetylase (PgdA/CDA1 family)